jgi:hypothetical protein
MELSNFEWLNGVADTLLNPKTHQSKQIDKNIGQITEWLESECNTILDQFRQYASQSPDSGQYRSLLIHQYNRFIMLLNKVYENLLLSQDKDQDLNKANTRVFARLKELQQILLQNHQEIMAGHQATSFDQLDPFKEELLTQYENFKQGANTLHGNGQLVELVINAIDDTVQKINSRISFPASRLNTLRNFLDGLLATPPPRPGMPAFSNLEELLISCNMNSKGFIAYFQSKIQDELTEKRTTEQQLMDIYHIQDSVVAIIETGEAGYEPAASSLKSILISHLDKLAESLDDRQERSQSLTHQGRVSDSKAAGFKVHCNLSADQLGLILRAADDIKAIIAKSLSAVFRSIVPYLSTNRKDELSWQSVRSKAVSAEDRDKEIAIAALEEMINKIRGY